MRRVEFGCASRKVGNLFLTTALMSGLIAMPGSARNVEWIGAGAGTFLDLGNWLEGVVPGAGDTVEFPGGSIVNTVNLGGAVRAIGGLDVSAIDSIQNGTIQFGVANADTTHTLTYSDTEATALADSLTLDINGNQLNVSAETDLIFGGGITNTAGAGTLSLSTAAGHSMTLSGASSLGMDDTIALTGGEIVVGSGQAGNTLFDGIAGTTLSLGAILDINGQATIITDLTGVGTITNNGADAALLTVNGGDDTTFDGQITDGDSLLNLELDKSDADALLTLTGQNTHTGVTTITQGVLALANADGMTLDDDSQITIGANGTLRVDVSEDVGAISGQGDINLNGAGVTLTVGSDGSANTSELSGIISGAGGLTMNDADNNDIMTLAGENTFTGATQVASGTLQLNNATGTGAILNTGSVEVSGGTLQLAADETIGDLSATGGTIDLQANDLTFGTENDTSIAAGITGTGALVLQGTGTVSVTSANPTGAFDTTINAGAIDIGADGALGTGLVTINGAALSASVDATSANDLTVAGSGATLSAANATSLTLTGGDFVNEGGALTLGTEDNDGTINLAFGTITNDPTSTVAIANGTVEVGSGAVGTGFFTGVAGTEIGTDGTLDLNGYDTTVDNLSGNGTITATTDAALTLGGTGPVAFGGTIEDGAGVLSLAVKMATDADVLTLSGTNVFSGGTSIDTGVLSIDTAAAIGTGNVTLNGGTLTSTGTLSLANGLTVSTTGGILGAADGQTISLTGDYTNAGGLLELGSDPSADLPLTGTIGLNVASVSNTATGSVAIAGGTVQVQNETTGTYFFNGIASTDIQSAGTLDVNGTATTIANLTGSGSLTNTATSATDVTLTGTGDTTFSGVISGEGASSLGVVVDTDTGSITLSGTNTYDGTTQVQSGTLILSDGTAILDTGSVEVSGGTLELAADETIGDLSASAGTIDLQANDLTFGTENDTSIAAGITGTGTLILLGTGTVSVTSANPTGAFGTTINAGAIDIGADGALGTGLVTINGAALSASVDATSANDLTVTGSGATLSAANATSLALTGGDFVNEGGALTLGTEDNDGTINLAFGDVDNNPTSTVTIANGTVEVGSAAVGTGFFTGVAGTEIGTDATLDLNGTDTAVDNLSGTGTISATTGATLTVGGAGVTTFDGVIENGTGVLALTVDMATSDDVLTLTNTNTFTGNTMITKGILDVQDGSALADATVVDIAADGTLRVTDAEQIAALSGTGAVDLTASLTLDNGTVTVATGTYDGDISGDGGLTVAGNTDQTLSGTNSYTGMTRIEDDAQLTLDDGAAILDTGSVTISDNGTLALLVGETIGALSASGGTIALGTDALTFGTETDTEIAAAITGTTGSLIKQGDGTVTVASTNTGETFSTTVNAGTVAIGADDALGGGLITLDDGTLQVDVATTVANAVTVSTAGGTIAGADGVDFEITGALTNNGALTFGDGTAMSSITVNAATVGATATATIAENTTLVLGAASALDLVSDNATVTGTLDLFGQDAMLTGLSGTGVITTTDTPLTTVTLSGPTTYTGAFTDGVDGAGVPSVLALNVDVGAGETFTLGTAAGAAAANAFSGATTITSGTMSVSGGNAIGDTSDVTVLSTGTLDVQADETIGSITGDGGVALADAATLTIGGDSATTYDGVMSGDGGLTVGSTGSTGSLTLNQAQTYTGTTTVESGTLILGVANTLSNNGDVVVNGVLDLNATDETIGSLAGTGNVAMGAGTLTITGEGETTFGGAIAGTGALIVDSTSGSLTLGGENTFTGGTVIETGTLALSDTGALVAADPDTIPTVTLGVAGGADESATLDNAGTIAGPITIVAGTAINAGTGTMDNVALNGGVFNTSGTVTGTAEIAGGTMIVGGGTVAQIDNTAGVLDINAGTITTVNSATTTTNAGNITSANVTGGTFTNEGGSVTTATVSAGSFVAQGGTVGTLANNGAEVTVSGASVGNLSNSGTAMITGGSVASMTNSGTASNAGSIGELAQNGGSFTNSGNITTASVAAGVALSSSGSIGSLNNNGGSVDIQGGSVGSASNAGGTLTIGAATVGALTSTGQVTSAGSITTAQISGGSFNNSGSVTGDTEIAAGTVTNSGTLQTVTLSSGSLKNTGGTTGAITNTGGDIDISGGVTGAITNDSGTLNIGASGSAGAIKNAATASNAGTVASLENTAGTFNNSGTITDATSITGGDVTNSGTMGDVSVSGGSFEGTAGAIGALTNAGGEINLTGGTVASVNNEVGTLDLALNTGAVTNAATLNLSGTASSLTNTDGTATVSGTVTGATNLIAGIITNTGTLGGGVTVEAGTLNSSGTIGGTLAANGGTTNLSGRLNGALQAGDGDVTIVAGLSDVVSIDNTGNGSLVIAAGTTRLDSGGTVTNAGDLSISGGLSGTGQLTNTGNVTIAQAGFVAMDVVNDGALDAQGAITGDVTNAATGTLVMSGTQAGAISNLGDMIVSGSATGQVTNAARFTLADTGSVAGDVSNTGTFDLQGRATGDVTNNATLTLAETGDVTGDVTNNSTLDLLGQVTGDVTNANTLQLGGGVSGTVTNQDRTTLIADRTATVGAFVNDAEFAVGEGSMVFGSFVNNGTVDIFGGADISGGTLGEIASGSRVITGNTLTANSFSSIDTAFTVQANVVGDRTFTNNDTLTVRDGGQISAGQVINNGLLTLPGGGSIAADVVNNAQMNVVGTNQAGGTLTNTASGIIQLASNGSTSDVLNVTGDANLNGVINLDMNLGRDIASVDRISVGGQLSGDLVLNFTDLSTEFSVLPESLSLLEFGTVDPEFTFQLNGLPNGGALVYGVAVNSEASGLQLQSGANPAVAGIASGLTLTQSLINTVVNRPSSPFVSGLAAEDDKPCGFGTWARGVGGQADASGDTNTSIGTFNSTISASYGGLQAGFDYSCFDNRFAGFDLSFGGILGMNQGSLSQPVFQFDSAAVSLNRSIQTSTNETDFTQTYGGLYLGGSRDRLFADVQFRFDQTAFDLTNRALLPSAADGGPDDLGVADQEFDSTSSTISGSVGYAFPLGGDLGLVFVPAVGISHSRTSVDDLRFDGGTVDFTDDDGVLQIDDIVSTVGFISGTLSRSKVLPSGTAVINYFGTATYYQDFGGDTTSRFYELDANGKPFGEPLTTTSSNLGAYGEISLGVNYTKLIDPGRAAGARQFDASVRVDARFSDNLDGYGITAQMRFQF
ncbi:Outer membrane autotransporter barrel domain protein [Sulfitobacter noctilucae]|uniref:autotransporter-associated beta strand repeat-containing protein n=1 Tax=Sulfitobacter noctilucae TaxID=1342302 RepID=UPI00046958FC|nr:autotransporter-associated beta strand repeat-containing protein [Sulfitobacter noctilucae]KIN75146.1 Outer membrane autotransporter barrel domain protein [Sulfitobacter noctilucae]